MNFNNPSWGGKRSSSSSSNNNINNNNTGGNTASSIHSNNYSNKKREANESDPLLQTQPQPLPPPHRQYQATTTTTTIPNTNKSRISSSGNLRSRRSPPLHSSNINTTSSMSAFSNNDDNHSHNINNDDAAAVNDDNPYASMNDEDHDDNNEDTIKPQPLHVTQIENDDDKDDTPDLSATTSLQPGTTTTTTTTTATSVHPPPQTHLLPRDNNDDDDDVNRIQYQQLRHRSTVQSLPIHQNSYTNNNNNNDDENSTAVAAAVAAAITTMETTAALEPTMVESSLLPLPITESTSASRTSTSQTGPKQQQQRSTTPTHHPVTSLSSGTTTTTTSRPPSSLSSSRRNPSSSTTTTSSSSSRHQQQHPPNNAAAVPLLSKSSSSYQTRNTTLSTANDTTTATTNTTDNMRSSQQHQQQPSLSLSHQQQSQSQSQQYSQQQQQQQPPLLEIPEEIYAIRKAALQVLKPLNKTWVVISVGFALTVLFGMARWTRLLPHIPFWFIVLPCWMSHVGLLWLHILSAKALSAFIADANESRQRPDSRDHLNRTEYLPLLQRSLKFGLKTGLLSFCVFFFEILMYVRVSRNTISLGTAFAPLWVLVTVGILDGLICKTQHVIRVICWMLTFSAMIMTVLKVDYGYDSIRWRVVVSPVITVLSIASSSLIYIVYGHQIGFYRLTESQLTAGNLYSLAALICIVLIVFIGEVIPLSRPVEIETRLMVVVLAPLVVSLVGMGAWVVSRDEFGRFLLYGGQSAVHPKKLRWEAVRGWTSVQGKGVTVIPMFGEVAFQPLGKKPIDQSIEMFHGCCCTSTCYPTIEDDGCGGDDNDEETAHLSSPRNAVTRYDGYHPYLDPSTSSQQYNSYRGSSRSRRGM